jgi:hypothetical protein
MVMETVSACSIRLCMVTTIRNGHLSGTRPDSAIMAGRKGSMGLKGWKADPLTAVGYVAAGIVFAIAAGWRMIFKARPTLHTRYVDARYQAA